MEGNVEVDIESGDFRFEKGSSISSSSECDSLLTRSGDVFSKSDVLRGDGSGEVICEDVHVVIEKNCGIECKDHLVFDEKSYSKEKRSRPNSNKHTKPPRPPKGPLLDASDMMLVKKISEIAAKRRERIGRTRALKKMKAAKGSSSGGSILAMVITVLFLFVMMIQGVCSRGGIRVQFPGSPKPSVTDNGLISVQFHSKPPENVITEPIDRYPRSDNPASGSVPRVEEGRDVQ